ncbi:MAG: SUMF1/EgtB/PvdO family nonheme iron enzyme, partial [Phycisphaerales bacterium]
MMDRTGVLGWVATAGVAAGMLTAGSTAEAGGVPPSYGFDFATIGDVGNPHYMPTSGAFPRPRGRVDYEYRIAKTEVRAVEWLEFVRAYAPHYTPGEVGGGGNNNGFTGQYIFENGTLPDGTTNYSLLPSNNNRPANMSWYMAARYCNWLHNGKASGKWAFEDGAYDTSVFEQIDANEFTMEYARRADAKYWIPSVDEWTKAAYWDPNRYGEGLGGYWEFPNTSDVAPVSGLPGEGGETSAGDAVLALPDPYVVEFVGLYPDVQSPWGLLDLSGTRRDWTTYEGGFPALFSMGTNLGTIINELF